MSCNFFSRMFKQKKISNALLFIYSELLIHFFACLKTRITSCGPCHTTFRLPHHSLCDQVKLMVHTESPLRSAYLTSLRSLILSGIYMFTSLEQCKFRCRQTLRDFGCLTMGKFSPVRSSTRNGFPVLRPMVLFFAILAIIYSFPAVSISEVLVEDTVWEGDVLVDDDVLIPEGVTLTVQEGTSVRVSPASTTRTDPQYMSSLTEITVRGRLVVEGTSLKPVTFQLNPGGEGGDAWAGIIIDDGTAQIHSSTIQDAESGIWIIGGSVQVKGSTLTSNRYGLVAQRESVRVNITETLIQNNEYGLLALNGAAVQKINSTVSNNRKKDFHSLPAADLDFDLKHYEASPEEKAEELTDEVLLGTTIWQGRIRITGQVRVPVDSRLIILPGTIIEFAKKDTNGDGIGESGLMLQGVLIAKGTAREPILFRSAEAVKSKGDWDAVNIINSDGVRNLIEYCQLEDAYRGLHFHFSNVIIQQSIFRNNYRGVQFQESTVELRRNQFYQNISAVQARDSEIVFTDNQLQDNIFGANFLRAHLTIHDNTFGGNIDFGLKIREGFPTLTRNIFHHNRFGLMLSDTAYGSIAGNLMADSSETGLSVRSGSNMEIKGNFIQGNGLSGISVRDTSAIIEENHISKNGERGIGLISFTGSITDNSLVDNLLYAIAIEDGSDVSAPSNWYGQDDIEPIIFDRTDDPTRGKLQYKPVLGEPLPITWPLAKLPLDFTWSGKIAVPETVSIPADTALTIKPGSTLLFAKDAGLYIRGRFLARGTKDARIKFTALQGQEPKSWGEIRIEHSEGSSISNCDFEYATWGIHSHFNSLPIAGCSFSNNGGALRFRSGPLQVRNSLFSDNTIGIRAFRGSAEITGNIITRNDKGVFIREKGGGLIIKRNNIFGNRDYNIWIGDFNTEDVEAPENWWGIDDPTETIFDARREPGIGMVHFDPVLSEALDIKIVDEE